jgi:hypothetical protein
LSDLFNIMIRYLQSLLFVFFILIGQKSIGQGSTSLEGFGIEANVFAGKVIKHEKKFELPIPQLTSGVDINFQWKTYGKKDWQQRRRYPVLGIGVTYTNYGIDSIYGRCFSVL